ncbi:MAG: GxxExxY protein [Pirellulaceae bacterium]
MRDRGAPSIGTGTLESAYEKCLAFELRENGIQFQRQLPMPVEYKETRLEVVTASTF